MNSLEAANNTSRKLGGIDSARANSKTSITIHQAVAEGVEMVLKQSAASRSLDNITAVILGFNNFEQTIQKLNEGLTLQQIKEQNIIENKHRRFLDKFDDSQVIPEDFNFIQQSSKPMSSPPISNTGSGR